MKLNALVLGALTVIQIFAINAEAAKRPLRAVAIGAGYEQTCALLETGDLKCWGNNDKGQLGQEGKILIGGLANTMGDNLPPIRLGKGRKVTSFSVSESHTCAVLDDKSLKCWGDNTYGNLGLQNKNTYGAKPETMGDILPKIKLGTGRSAVQVSAGNLHTCVLLDNGQVKCWGNGDFGQLGLGKEAKNVGIASGSMGDQLTAVNLGAGRKAIKVGAGTYFSCALLDNGDIKCWGYGEGSALGSEDTKSLGATADTIGDKLPRVKLGTGRKAIDLQVNVAHVCALLDDRSLKCWGANNDGRLGLEDTTRRGGAAGTMGDALPVVNLGTALFPVSLPPSSYASNGSCVLLVNSAVKCWGSGGSGQLGGGNTQAKGNLPRTMGDSLNSIYFGKNEKIIAVVSGAFHTCGLNGQGRIKCFGANNRGQLGYADLAPRGFNSETVPSLLPYVDLGTIEDGKFDGVVVGKD